MDIVAERACVATSPNGDVLNSVVWVGKPEAVSENRWQCLTSIGVIPSDPAESLVFGMDGWDALQAGMRFVYLRLEGLESIGWKFKWFGQEESLECLLPLVGATEVKR